MRSTKEYHAHFGKWEKAAEASFSELLLLFW